jgi:hypothetical protein
MAELCNLRIYNFYEITEDPNPNFTGFLKNITCTSKYTLPLPNIAMKTIIR